MTLMTRLVDGPTNVEGTAHMTTIVPLLWAPLGVRVGRCVCEWFTTRTKRPWSNMFIP